MEQKQTLFEQALKSYNLPKKQEAVLLASLHLFAEQGYEATSSSQIAARAQVAEGSVYRHFKTKRGILEVILSSITDELLPRMSEEFITELKGQTGLDFQDFLTYLVHNRLEFLVENQLQIKILLQETGSNPQYLKVLVDKFHDVIDTSIWHIFDHYKKQGRLVDWDVMRIFTYVAWAILSAALPYIYLPAQPFDIDQKTKEISEFLVKGLTPGKL
ncbi:TetR/AcrR family transcriptional regulator [Streptococcus gallolyticus]|nr:TetR/AcrR family transcriptional regulator [Streptococcus gallolyticus]AQP41292.1 transcriptional regulator [Streptococcus gallolyticus subsp. gallolyticus DSM 16831]